MARITLFGRKMEPEIYRMDYKLDKLGKRVGAIFYYKVERSHRKMCIDMLKEFDLSNEDKPMLRRLLRTNEYSEFDRTRLAELRRMYIEDNLIQS